MDIKKTWLFEKPIAHRGLHNDEIPENSLAAYENAIAHGYPIELDVRIIDDGNVIVFHDDKLSRMTKSDGYAGNLKTEDLDEIRLLKSDERIPTFEQTLSCVNGRVPMLIEIKNTSKVGDLEGKVIDMLKSYVGDYAVQSFNPYSMGYFKDNAPHILRGQLSTFFHKGDISLIKRFVLKRLKMNHVSCPDFISYNFKNLPNKYVTRTQLPVLAWTVRSNAEMETALKSCDNIIFEKFIPEV